MRPCSICRRDDRRDLERCLAMGDSFRAVGRAFKVSKDAVARHAHHGAPIRQPELERAIVLLDELRTLLAGLAAPGRQKVQEPAVRVPPAPRPPEPTPVPTAQPRPAVKPNGGAGTTDVLETLFRGIEQKRSQPRR